MRRPRRPPSADRHRPTDRVRPTASASTTTPPTPPPTPHKKTPILPYPTHALYTERPIRTPFTSFHASTHLSRIHTIHHVYSIAMTPSLQIIIKKSIGLQLHSTRLFTPISPLHTQYTQNTHTHARAPSRPRPHNDDDDDADARDDDESLDAIARGDPRARTRGRAIDRTVRRRTNERTNERTNATATGSDVIHSCTHRIRIARSYLARDRDDA